jgi:hypothetical protein
LAVVSFAYPRFESREMSNMIALVSLDFGGTGSSVTSVEGVEADGRAFS